MSSSGWRVAASEWSGRSLWEGPVGEPLGEACGRGLWERLAGLEPSGGHLGPSWGVLGPSWGHLGLSWGHHGVVLGTLGAVLGLSWAVLGRLGAILDHLGPKHPTEPKKYEKKTNLGTPK